MSRRKYQAKIKEIERLEKSIEEKQMERQHIVERILALEAEKTVYNECIYLFTFFEYNGMKDQELSDFDRGRFLVLRAITNMVTYDPKTGLKRKNMSDEDKDHWTDIDNDLIQGGSILYNINAMYDDELWELIPKKLEKYIKSQFGKII